MTITPRLTAKVKAFNAAHKAANELYPTLAAFFTPFVGEKILKADNTFLSKIASNLPTLPATPRLHIFRYHNVYALGWTVKASEMDSDHTCVYAEADVRVGYLNLNVLTALASYETLRTDYTAEEVVGRWAEYEKAQKEADRLKSAMWPFDNNNS